MPRRTRVREAGVPLLDCTVHKSDGVVWASCSGEFDSVLTPELMDVLLAAARANQHRLVLDLSDVSYLLSLGLGQLFALAETLRRNGGALILVCPPGDINRLLAISGVRRMGNPMTLHDNLDAGLSFARGGSTHDSLA